MIYDENEVIGRRLMHVRKLNRMECWEMAKILDVSEGHYRKIERGLYGLDVRKVKLLYNNLHVDPVYLLTGETDIPEIYMRLNGVRNRKDMVMELLRFCIRQISEYTEVK